MNTSIILLFLGLGSLCLVGVLGQTDSVVFNIRIDIPYCNNCGMTDLGQISVKVTDERK